ncbi:MAG: hypothetical protein MUF38_08215 [Anaerolineae bacterium]|nr:hypothetical protein [Anaerolineae bacterium]
MTVELETLLSPQAYARLKDEAERRHTPINEVVRDALESYVRGLDDDEDTSVDLGDLEDPSDEAVLGMLRTAIEQVKAGQGRPAREALADLRTQFGDDDEI